MHKRVSRGPLIATAMAVAALTALPAGVAIAAESDEALEEIIVTGTSIRRVEAEGALPVQVFAQEEIQRSGATSVTDFIQRIPVMQGFTSIADTVGGSGGGVTTASLHDVGEQYTLVLLNGRRVAPATSGTTIDLNSIPLAAIERIEVLTDGASALYGADAIAGVVNFILKRGEAPLTINARYSRPQKAGGQEWNASISKGFGDFAADGYEAFVALSYDRTRQLRAKQRDFAKTGIISGRFGDLNYDFFNGSSRSVPPNVDVYDESFTPLTSFSPYREANGDCPPDHVAIGRQCYFDYTSTVEIAPELKRTAVYGSGKIKLGDSGWNAFGDLAYTDVSTIARIAPYPAEFLMDTSHPYYSTYILPYLTSEQAATAAFVNVKYRLYDMGNRTYDYATKSLHMVGGVEGKVGGWTMSGALTVSKQKQETNYLNGFPLADKFTAGMDEQLFDPFPYVLGTMPAEQLEALKATQYKGNYSNNHINMTALDANAQHALFNLAGGDSIISVGADYRRNSYDQVPNSAVAHAEILFDDQQPSFDMSRNSWGVYSEFLAPVTKTLEFTAAVRHDQIGGVRNKIDDARYGDTESATTYKIGGKWQVLSSLALRASYGTGFRTASMREIAQPRIDWGVTSGTYDCPFNAGYDPLGYFAANYVCADGLQYEVYQGGNPGLKPEKSKQWNVGLIWQPIGAFTAGLNFWSVEIEDAVTSVSEQLILENPAKYLSLFTTKYKASNGLTYVAILDAPINIGRTQNEGLDWDINYEHELSFGKLRGTLAGTHLTKSRYTMPGTDDVWTTSLNKFGVNDAVSFRDVISGTLTLGYGSWEHSLTAYYRNGYKDQAYTESDCVFYTDAGDCAAGALDVPSHTTFDWRTRWDAMESLTVVLGIENLFDKDPPRSLRVNGAGHQLGYDPRYASPFGRTFALSVEYRL
jgi:iron complex outermembrane receptor protein